MSKPTSGLNGFVKIKRTGNHATLWVEGLDDTERSVAGIAMTKAQVETFLRRVRGVLEHWPEDTVEYWRKVWG